MVFKVTNGGKMKNKCNTCRVKRNEKHKIWASVVRLPTNACKLQLIAIFYNHADKK